jgi:hypothetical protein
MKTKDIAINTIRHLPDDADWETIQESINFMAGVRKGWENLTKGRVSNTAE